MEFDRPAVSGQKRTRLPLPLIGRDHADGEIPPDRLGQVAERTKELVLRIARGLSDREGAGRTLVPARAATRLLLRHWRHSPRRSRRWTYA